MSEMTPERHAKIKEVFTAVIAMPVEERAAGVSRLCAGDDGLALEVHRLLDDFNPNVPTLAPPALAGAPLLLSPMADSPLAPAGRNDVTRHLSGENAAVGAAGQQGGVAASAHDDGAADQDGTAPVEFAPGQEIAGRYRIISALGVGGMGSVYRADDLRLSQQVALKFLSRRFAADPAALSRFLNEVRIAREIAHPNVCRVFDIGDADGTPFISMEYVDGENLATLLKRIGRPTGDKALDIARQICAGLSAAHARGVLHRDLKPANIMLDGEGRVRITDFGLAGIIGEVRPHEIRSGTPRYMAPEQIAGTAVSQRSDIYSLGLVLYEVFTGKPAFDAGNAAEYFKLHRSADPPTPSSIVADLDPVVERVILACVQKEPSLRPASVLDVAAMLPGGDTLAAALAAGETPSPESVANAGRHDRMSTSMAGAALVLLGGLIGLVIFMGRLPDLDRWRNLPRSPKGLSHPCWKIIEQAGFEPPAHSADGWLDTSEVSASAFGVKPQRGARPANTREFVPEAMFSRIVYWFRAADTPLTTTGAMNNVLAQARVQWDDPPRPAQTECDVALAPDGKLLYFAARDCEPLDAAEPLSNVWDALFKRAGFDRAQFTEAESSHSPPMFADTRHAWQRTEGDSDMVRMEAAARGGRACYFNVLRATSRQPPESVIARRERFTTATLLVIFALLLIGAPLARRNLDIGGADRRGARRLALSIAALHLLAWLLHSSHASEPVDELNLLRLALVGAFAEAAMVWMFYIALEPYIRRYWPQCMISWTRFVANRSYDPLVGRHLLLGAVLGAGFTVMTRVDAALPVLFGETARIQLRDPSSVMSFMEGRHAVAAGLDRVRIAAYESLAFALILVLLQSRLRRPTFAIVGSALLVAIMYVPRGAHPVTSWIAIGLGIILPAFWLLTREGLLMLMVASLIMRLLLMMPTRLDLGAWHSDVTFLILGIVAAVALHGYFAATRGGSIPAAAPGAGGGG